MITSRSPCSAGITANSQSDCQQFDNTRHGKYHPNFDRHEQPSSHLNAFASNMVPFTSVSGGYQQHPPITSQQLNTATNLPGSLYTSGVECETATAYELAHPDLNLNPEHDVLSDATFEPRMMFIDQNTLHWTGSPIFAIAHETNDSIPRMTDTNDLSQSFCNYSIADDGDHHFRNSHTASEISMSSPGEDVEDSMDKPYARLIYEALMQAPGHRMMLREIYDWFMLNTSKAQGSSSNGWQNSIRHNLSMNQAFENDKTEQAACGHAKKANSLWYLTGEAIRNGVQSTTRFRKSGPPKRGVNQRANQAQRQQSGAKGGKATKRAVLQRKRIEVSCRDRHEQPLPAYSSSYIPEPVDSPQGAIALDRNVPATPADESMYEHAYGLPKLEATDSNYGIKREDSAYDSKDMLDNHSMDTWYAFGSMPLGHPTLSQMFV